VLAGAPQPCGVEAVDARLAHRHILSAAVLTAQDAALGAGAVGGRWLESWLRLSWTGQTSRHGNQNPTRDETRTEAQMAVYIATTLVAWFACGAVQRVSWPGKGVARHAVGAAIKSSNSARFVRTSSWLAVACEAGLIWDTRVDTETTSRSYSERSCLTVAESATSAVSR
jgi:hypothetical protein